jgi:ribosomal protein L29
MIKTAKGDIARILTVQREHLRSQVGTGD